LPTSRKKYQVRVSDQAQRMLTGHILFLARINKKAAAKKKRQLMTAIRSLAAMPFRFPLFQETDEICLPLNKYRKMFVENWYLVLYCVEDDTVSVEYILDCRQEEYQWLLE
jgi:plasmid stabilization system protein ParE